jgi:competence protein ComEC
LNKPGSDHLLAVPNGALGVNAHIFKAPHHGSHEFSTALFEAVHPMITIVSSGEIPDHGHPRANFLGAIGRAGRGEEPLLFSTEIAALFVDSGDPSSVADAGTVTTLGDLDFSQSAANAEARQRFKKVLPGLINVRTDGEQIFAFRRVQQGYQWESYGPIEPVH